MQRSEKAYKDSVGQILISYCSSNQVNTSLKLDQILSEGDEKIFAYFGHNWYCSYVLPSLPDQHTPETDTAKLLDSDGHVVDMARLCVDAAAIGKPSSVMVSTIAPLLRSVLMVKAALGVEEAVADAFANVANAKVKTEPAASEPMPLTMI
jgi:hypothetical protein